MSGIKSTAAWRLARGLKRAVVPPRSAEPLPAESCRGSLAVVNPPVALEVATTTNWTLRVLNHGAYPWPSDGPNPVQLQVQWFSYAGKPLEKAVQLPLPRPIFPGEPDEVTMTLAAPTFVGDYHLVLQLHQAHGGSFAERCPDFHADVVHVPVMGRRAADIDYHQVYRTADLQQNHWWVVGAYHSKEQYESSKADRRGMLIQCGLTPQSRVLDIGCGTGQMADALQEYLTVEGAYYGTDIGKEAIAFCQKEFTRPNFVFRVGEMTRLPFGPADGMFNLAIYFSVFTHTFTDESALLLAETKRCLKPTGKIVADIIVSDLVERCAGNRGEMIVNREHFLRLAGMLGFQAKVIGQWPWNSHAERLMIVFEL